MGGALSAEPHPRLCDGHYTRGRGQKVGGREPQLASLSSPTYVHDRAVRWCLMALDYHKKLPSSTVGVPRTPALAVRGLRAACLATHASETVNSSVVPSVTRRPREDVVIFECCPQSINGQLERK